MLTLACLILCCGFSSSTVQLRRDFKEFLFKAAVILLSAYLLCFSTIKIDTHIYFSYREPHCLKAELCSVWHSRFKLIARTRPRLIFLGLKNVLSLDLARSHSDKVDNWDGTPTGSQSRCLKRFYCPPDARHGMKGFGHDFWTNKSFICGELAISVFNFMDFDETNSSYK